MPQNSIYCKLQLTNKMFYVLKKNYLASVNFECHKLGNYYVRNKNNTIISILLRSSVYCNYNKIEALCLFNGF